MTVPKDFCTLRNKKGLATVREWGKWKEKMGYDNYKYEFKISEVEQAQVRTRPRYGHEVG